MSAVRTSPENTNKHAPVNLARPGVLNAYPAKKMLLLVQPRRAWNSTTFCGHINAQTPEQNVTRQKTVKKTVSVMLNVA